jgi:hypothetical protein
MIYLDREELEAQFRITEEASAEFDARAANAPSSQVRGGLATFALVDMLATFSHVALLAVQHVDATVEIGKDASADLTMYEASVGEELTGLNQGLV